MVYLFIGEDELGRDSRIRTLKKQLFPANLEPFNCEVLSARDLDLLTLQEAFQRLPVEAKKRLLIIKEISRLKADLQEHFLAQLKNLPESIVLALHVLRIDRDDTFLNQLSSISKVVLLNKARAKVDAFTLAQAIESQQPEDALNILTDLLREGEKPERILGGLRYQLTKGAVNLKDKTRKIDLLLDADIKIKTGKLKPAFALEALVVKLCS